MADVLNDVYLALNVNPTFGSGGGTQGGRGGGRIILCAQEAISVFSSGKLLAEGSISKSAGSGSGSGGSVLIVAQYFYNYGVISANGGKSSIYGAAGGGGRISLLVRILCLFYYL
jgi:hypothetical protein